MKKFMSVLSGFLVMIALMSLTPVFAETASKIDVIFDRVKLFVNGEPVDKETLLYNGTTYIPLRAVAEILNKQVSWDESINSAVIGDRNPADGLSSEQTQYPENIEVPNYGVYFGVQEKEKSFYKDDFWNDSCTYTYDVKDSAPQYYYRGNVCVQLSYEVPSGNQYITFGTMNQPYK